MQGCIITALVSGNLNKEVNNMIKKLIIIVSFLLMFLQSRYALAQDFKYVEIFDPKQDKVVKVVQSTPQIQNMVGKWIQNINDIYGKNDPVTDDGYAIKVPLDPAIKVNSDSLDAAVSEVYIIIPEHEPPFYIIFDNENRLSYYPFNGDINILSKALEFKLNK